MSVCQFCCLRFLKSKRIYSNLIKILFAEENQQLAVQVLPHALAFLNGSTDVEIVRRLTLFITYVITNNGLLYQILVFICFLAE